MTTEIKKSSVATEQLSGLADSHALTQGDVLSAHRKGGLEAFNRLGIPQRKNEEYKYIPVEAIIRKEFADISLINTASDILVPELPFVKNTFKIVLVNGIYNPNLSSTEKVIGLTVSSLLHIGSTQPDLLKEHFNKSDIFSKDPFAALNTSVINDGLFIHVAKNTVIEKQIVILNYNTAKTTSLAATRNLIIADPSSQASITEVYSSSDTKLLHTTVTEMVVNENANIHHYRVQQEGTNTYQFNNSVTFVNKNAVYNTYTFTLSGALVRNNLSIILNEQHTSAHLFGLFAPVNSELVDNHTLVDHQQPNCESNELYKGIMNHKSVGVFNGKIYVRRDAQKTNAYQSSKNILLSDDASVNTKPQLEIYADDVKCSHGTSTGKMNEDALFYLKARGIGEESARKLLLTAFIGEVIEKVDFETLREYLVEAYQNKI